jgi:site-specific recombinase XerC
LTDSEAVAIYNACVTPLERIVIHGELKQGLRKYDLMNIKVEDVYDSFVYVLGKGDKRRSVPFVSDSKEVYAAWWAETQEKDGRC